MSLKDGWKIGLEDGSVVKVLALQTFELESHPQNPCKKSMGVVALA